MLTLDTHPALDALRKELTDIEARDHTYSLADAIREGSSVTGQKISGWHDEQGNVCALSAAYLAVRARGLL
jgi:hypothetical protein